MKKQNGFTLAEVLITLGIIGIVAALTMPTLVQSANNAKIGPELASAMSTLGNGVDMYLQENNATSVGIAMTKAGAADTNIGTLLEQLAGTHIKASATTAPAAAMKWSDNKTKAFDKLATSNKALLLGNKSILAAEDPGCALSSTQDCGVILFTTGYGKKEKILAGRDAFKFIIKNNGEVLPYGSPGSGTTADSQCSDTGMKGYTSDGTTCAGKIAEDGWTVNYM